MNSLARAFSPDTLFSNLAQRLVSFDTIMREPIPPIEWTVESILPTASRNVAFGEYGSMKSWLLLDLSLHIATGRPWLGTFAVPNRKAVLFIDEEMPERELRRRVKRLGEGMGLKESDIPFKAVSHVGVRFQKGIVEAFLKAINQTGFNPDIIIVETFRRVLIGSENEAEQVSEFWHSVAPILTAGKTLIISHHMRKPPAQGDSAVRHRASGSTDILAGTDTAYAITRRGDDLTISCVKNRMAVEPKPFHVVMEDDGSEDGSVTLQYVGPHPDDADEPSKVEQARGAIQVFLGEQPGLTAMREDILGHLEELHIAERTGDRALAALHTEQILERSNRGRYHLNRWLKVIEGGGHESANRQPL